MIFKKTKWILADWLDHAQRNSGYMCDKDYREAIAELDQAESFKPDKLLRMKIISGLSICTSAQQNRFRRMYARKSGTIEEVVNHMPVSKLAWAWKQIQNTLKKL